METRQLRAGLVRQNCEPGFALVELCMAGAVLVVGSLAMITTLLSSATAGIDARKQSLARDEAQTVSEEFRASCETNFAAAVQQFNGRTVPCLSLTSGKASASILTTVALDETAIQPPMDLNGDGDATDTHLTPAELKVAYLTSKVTWAGGRRTMTFTTMLAASEVAASASGAGAGAGGGAGTPPPPPESVVTLTTSKLTATQLTASLDVAGASMNVAGITIDTSTAAYVSQIKINGATVFSGSKNLPPTGQMIVTQPFTMPVGPQTINPITFVGTASGGKVDVSKSSMSLTFHTESGDRVVIIK
ncbi:MAG TPA: hypothetical protein VK348_01310 [Planctomycetota bacterium]|nr:hypothetical protein [Planctomycetota bacterium]